MGYTTTAYAFYGVYIPREQWPYGSRHLNDETGRIDAVLKANKGAVPDVGHLEAGKYDEDMLFLTADVTPGENLEVALGSFKRFEAANSVRLMELTGQLRKAALLLGYNVYGLESPGYISVPDCS